MERFDLIVIGGGPGGYLAAERAARGGLKVALLEKQKLGGVCLNEGCIPTKTLLNSAKHYEQALHGAAYGVTCAEVKLDQAAVIRRKNKVVRTLVAGVKSKLKAAKVTVLAEEARILGRQAEGFVVSGGEHRYAAPKLVIATGSSPVIPPIEGVREQLGSFVLTSREILDLEALPRRLTVIGGGVIGLEMAAYFAMAGTEVTVVEMQDHIGGMLDRELSQMLQKELGKKGITFLTGCRCQRVDAGMVLAVSKEGTEYQIPADRVLLSIGRRPNVQGLGLETVGVDYQPSGIPVDLTGQTNVAGIYAVGDVNGHHMLAHTAYREAEVAVNHILGKADSMRYHANPSVIYTQPEVASVGKTEEECRQKGIDYEVCKLSMRYSGRFVAENEGGDGLCKVLIHKKYRTVLGVHLLGSYAGEIIWGAAEMIELQLRVTDARQIIFPHPTVSEILRETLWEFPD